MKRKILARAAAGTSLFCPSLLENSFFQCKEKKRLLFFSARKKAKQNRKLFFFKNIKKNACAELMFPQFFFSYFFFSPSLIFSFSFLTTKNPRISRKQPAHDSDVSFLLSPFFFEKGNEERASNYGSEFSRYFFVFCFEVFRIY